MTSPKGGILICQTDKNLRIARILARVARFFAENGHVVKTLPSSLLLTGHIEVRET